MWHQNLGWLLKPGDIELSFCWQYKISRQERKPRPVKMGSRTEDPLIGPKGPCLQTTDKGGRNPTMQEESAKDHVCLQCDARSRERRHCRCKFVKHGAVLWSYTNCGLRLPRGEFNPKKSWEMPPGDRHMLSRFLLGQLRFNSGLKECPRKHAKDSEQLIVKIQKAYKEVKHHK